MPPIEINGQTVSDVQVNGQSVDEVTANGQTVFTAIPNSVIYQTTTPIDGLTDNDSVQNWPAEIGADIDGSGLTYRESSMGDFDTVDGDGVDDNGTTSFAWGSERGQCAFEFTIKTTTADLSAYSAIIDGDKRFQILLNSTGGVSSSEGNTGLQIQDDSGNRFGFDISTDIYDGNPHTVSFAADALNGNFRAVVDGSEVSGTIRDDEGMSGFSDFNLDYPFWARNFDGDLDLFSEFETTEFRIHEGFIDVSTMKNTIHDKYPWSSQ